MWKWQDRTTRQACSVIALGMGAHARTLRPHTHDFTPARIHVLAGHDRQQRPQHSAVGRRHRQAGGQLARPAGVAR